MIRIPGPDELSITLKVLSDPTRLRVLNLLLQGVQCNCELGGKLDLPMNLISHHLKVLREAGLVDAERDPHDARWVYYSINPERLERLRAQLDAFLDPARVKARLPACRPRTGAIEKRCTNC